MRSFRLHAAVGGLFAAVFVAPVGLEARPQTPGGASRPDSTEVRDVALDAQAAFERARVRRLAWTYGRSSQPCDEIVGRFCLWDDGGGWEPKPEDPDIAVGREQLLDRLAELARAFPGDEWIAGQRVRYLVESERPEAAIAVAAQCAAGSWWCRALEAYALHAASDYAGAERAFDRALGAMPADQRRRWNDLELLLDRDLRRVWRELSPGARTAFARWLWWLADPFWSVPGNERRTEHFARHVLDRMLGRTRTPYDVAWGKDLAELTIRYGWPAGWERVRSDMGTLGGDARPAIVGHDPPGGRSFLPPHGAFLAPFDARLDDWPIDSPESRSAYAPAYADSIVDLAHQLAVFRRGERAVVVVGYDLEASGEGPDAMSEAKPADPFDPGSRAALLVSAGPDEPLARARAS
ncbi:MAG: hypothetical protein ABR527_02885, partial [Gemmatimonadota bacterium]